MTIPTLNDWVWMQAMLNQAMLGVISQNVRQICLSYENGWKIEAVLEHPNDGDVDDIEDVAIETGIFMEGIKERLSSCAYAKVSASISVSSDPLENPNYENIRLIYRRKTIFNP